MKKAWVAGLLNVIPGLGYLYIDRKRAFGLWLIASDVLTTVSFFDPSTYDTTADVPITNWDLIAAVGGILLIVAFIVDAHAEAKRHNAKQHK